MINFALGKGDWIVKEAHAYGGKVIATVVNARHASRAQGLWRGRRDRHGPRGRGARRGP